MKTKLNLKSPFYALVAFIFGTHLFAKSVSANFIGEFPKLSFETLMLPDTSVQLQEGDTVEMYAAGGDSIFVLYEDSLADTSFALGWDIPFATEHMTIRLTDHHYDIAQGLFGVCLTDFFEPNHANQDELAAKYGTGPDPWDYLSQMRPKVLRFPSGAGGKFYQPLGSIRTNPDDIYEGYRNGGYGINIDEVIKFYDVTDNDFDAPSLYDVIGDPIPSIIEDMTDDNDCDGCSDWMDEGQQQTFEDNYFKWADQPIIDPVLYPNPEDAGSALYINQFIDLVQQIETENSYTVDVIICLNILNQTAAECVRIIEYLQDAGINVVGVEIGNEVYFEWAGLMMGFRDHDDVSAFTHYWDYINGHEYDDYSDGEDTGDGTYFGDFDLSSVLPSDVLEDHDYLTAINTLDPDLKIGIPAENFDPCETWDTPFIIDDPDEDVTFLGGGPGPCETCTYPQWNIDLETKFESTVGTGISTTFKFDAIIFHNYYVAGNAYLGCPTNTNWQVAATEPNFAAGAPYSTQWSLPTFDANLGELFEGIAGIPTDPDADATFDEQEGNFKTFVRSRIKNAFDIHATYLHFNEIDEEDTKEVWFTEYNILPKTKGATFLEDEPFVNMVPNTFAHSVALQNWVMWNVREYFDPDYKPGIFTIGTTQSFLGGNPIDMMSAATRNDQVMLDLPDPSLVCNSNPPYPEDAYYVPRTTYFTSQLLNIIPKLNLKYEKTFIGMFTGNNNIPPTTFLELDESGEPINVYVFYTNVKQITQKYAFDPYDLYLLIDGATSVTLGAATIYCINPAQLYSTSGRNAMFEDDINTGYSCSPGFPDLPHPFEIVDTWSAVSGTSCPAGFTTPTGGICVTVPATSAGYFVIPITPDYRKGVITPPFRLFPNPSDRYFIIQNTVHANYSDFLTVKIYSSFGSLVQSASVRPGEVVNTEKMPAGVYNVVITDQSNYSQNLKFTKIH